MVILRKIIYQGGMVMKRLFVLFLLNSMFISSSYADSWSLLGPTNSGSFTTTSYSYGMVPAEAMRIYSNGGTSGLSNGSYYVNNQGFSTPWNGINIYTRPNRYYAPRRRFRRHGLFRALRNYGYGNYGYTPMRSYGTRIINH